MESIDTVSSIASETAFHARRATGVFCLPDCSSTGREDDGLADAERYSTARAVLAAGYRPCPRCRPLEPPGETPEEIAALFAALEAEPLRRLRDGDLRSRGLDPAAVRRWFQTRHGLTFHAYQRGLRLAGLLHELSLERDDSERVGSPAHVPELLHELLHRLAGAVPADDRDGLVVHLTLVATPLGPMILGATTDGVCLLEFTDRRMLETQLKRLVQRLGCVFAAGANEPARRLENELEAYFDGSLLAFETPLVTPGTDFQRRVWDELQTIPLGATRSYGEQARRIEAPRAVRAVARANGDNRIAIVIPCHRVIGADGSLTGYGGGLWRKEWLLRHEGVALRGDEDPHQARLAFDGEVADGG
ncbi:MAG: methylated-DNA--[protein]-cysteine S-methyltransferase [Acidobacteriota bacterium]